MEKLVSMPNMRPLTKAKGASDSKLYLNRQQYCHIVAYATHDRGSSCVCAPDFPDPCGCCRTTHSRHAAGWQGGTSVSVSPIISKGRWRDSTLDHSSYTCKVFACTDGRHRYRTRERFQDVIIKGLPVASHTSLCALIRGGRQHAARERTPTRGSTYTTDFSFFTRHRLRRVSLTWIRAQWLCSCVVA